LLAVLLAEIRLTLAWRLVATLLVAADAMQGSSNSRRRSQRIAAISHERRNNGTRPADV
jgi:hypothetical protein